jgi:hypothetical protein
MLVDIQLADGSSGLDAMDEIMEFHQSAQHRHHGLS